MISLEFNYRDKNISVVVILYFLINLAICNELQNSKQAVTPNIGQLISPIEVIGNKFFDNKTGSQFFMKGIAYQRARKEGEIYDNTKETSYLDQLANTTTCLRDLKYLTELGINVVRVYQINPSLNHDICINAFAEAGIYILADLSEPGLSINRHAPSWDTELFDRYTSVIDSLHKYPNVLGFIAGNEVTDSRLNTNASPFVKAAIRDSKYYIRQKGYRKIPVGCASNDDSDIRWSISNYFICGDIDATADFFGINMYEWCGYSSYPTSGYRDRTLEYLNFPIPIFFSEYGCNIVSPRPFTEVEALYGSTMTKVWSGGIAYEYFEGINHYGMVKENTDGSITKLEDFEHLKSRLNSVEPKGVPIDNYINVRANITCEKPTEVWKASSKLPDKPDNGKCECLQSTLSCIVTPYKKINDNNLLEQVCSKVDCSEIAADGSTGEYGRFSDCGIKQKISYALNKYYVVNERKAEFCDFDGQAVLITNNDEVDLNNIFTADGRTCKEAIGEPLNYKKITQDIRNRKPFVTTDNIAPSTIHRDRRNKTKVLNSSGNVLVHELLEIMKASLVIIICISFVV